MNSGMVSANELATLGSNATEAAPRKTSGSVRLSGRTREKTGPEPSRTTDEAHERQLARIPICVSVIPAPRARTG